MPVNQSEASIPVTTIELSNQENSAIDTVDCLSDWHYLPPYLAPEHCTNLPHSTYASCSYCGVGDSTISGNSDNSCAARSTPSRGCIKFEYSRMKKKSAYPIHTSPSVLATSGRINITYSPAISYLSSMVLDHLREDSQILVYACGQVDYFAIFALQEVFRLLGVRNLTGNAEHCLNAGAVHNELLTGQEGPFVSIDQALNGDNRFYLFNGWNGLITHPPIFNRLLSKPELHAISFDVMQTETAQALENKLGSTCTGYIKSAGDPHLALAVANEIFSRYPHKISHRFVELWADESSFEQFKCLATNTTYTAREVALRVAAESRQVGQIENLIKRLAQVLAEEETIPVIVPSVGLSQSTGVVAHCLWAGVLAMLGKFGLNSTGDLLGGVLRLPGQINAESEVQGLSRKFFMGRIPMSDAVEAARRMDLPDHAYEPVLRDEPVAALDYSDPSPKRQLHIFFGTQFEANMPNRKRWLAKLNQSNTSIVVIDPIPDTWTLNHAQLILPSPPHPATPKLYQNGEWRLTLSIPQKKAAQETRSDATIIYDLMADIVKRFHNDPALLVNHPELAEHFHSGYLQRRFCPPIDGTTDTEGLIRVGGEVSRVQLFSRIQAYLSAGRGPLYCRFEHADGQLIRWEELLDRGSIVYGGVGTNRFQLNYETGAQPFADIYRKPRQFHFFIPRDNDLKMPNGLILNSGRSSMSDHAQRIAFAISSFNSGKATPVDGMPLQHPVYISQETATAYHMQTGQWVRLYDLTKSHYIDAPVVVSPRVFGKTLYISFHRSDYQKLQGFYVNDITDHLGRCNYSSQAKLKTPQIHLETLPAGVEQQHKAILEHHIANMTVEKLVPWDGHATDFIVTGVTKQADDCTSFKLQPKGPFYIRFQPGQYCTIKTNINSRKQSRAYSISSSPTLSGEVEITVKRVNDGLVSNWLADNVIVGDSLNVMGINGEFHLPTEALPDKLLFVAAGSGITPLMSMLRWLSVVVPKADIDFYISVRNRSNVLFAEELIHLENMMPNFNLWIVPTASEYENSQDRLRGRISSELLKKTSPDLIEREVYLCGPDAFMQTTIEILLTLGHRLSGIHKESFGLDRQRLICDSSINLKVQFSGPLIGNADQSISVAGDGSQTILEMSEANNVGLNSVCRSGSCGACLVKVIGETTQEDSDHLSPVQLNEGYRLACICYPKTDCRVELL